VTLPLLSPVIFYTLILAIVEVLQYFLVPSS
jgi:multiple sugar transport system permease protein